MRHCEEDVAGLSLRATEGSEAISDGDGDCFGPSALAKTAFSSLRHSLNDGTGPMVAEVLE